jgi:hypothetical protein
VDADSQLLFRLVKPYRMSKVYGSIGLGRQGGRGVLGSIGFHLFALFFLFGALNYARDWRRRQALAWSASASRMPIGCLGQSVSVPQLLDLARGCLGRTRVPRFRQVF